MHSNELRGKLVAIMKDRLASSIRQLPSVAARWPKGPASGQLPAPSTFPHALSKQLRILAQVTLTHKCA